MSTVSEARLLHLTGGHWHQNEALFMHAGAREVALQVASLVVDCHPPLQHADIAREAIEWRAVTIGQFVD